MTQQQQEYLDNILTILVYMLPNDIKDTTLLEEYNNFGKFENIFTKF